MLRISCISFGSRRARIHRYIRFTFMYMYQSRSLPDHAHHIAKILSLQSSSFRRTVLQLSRCLLFRRYRVCEKCVLKRPERRTPVTLLYQQLRPFSNLAHIGPACPYYIDAPAAASGLGPHISISMINAPPTSPRLRLNDTSAGDTAPVSCIRCVRVARA